MKNRCIYLIFIMMIVILVSWKADIKTIYVSPKGNDAWMGTAQKPIKTFAQAQILARKFSKNGDVKVVFKDGEYELSKTLNFTAQDNPSAKYHLYFEAEHAGKAIISGGAQLKLQWKAWKNGIYVAHYTSENAVDQLYVNGKRQRMARYPNAHPDSATNVYDAWELKHEAKANPDLDALNPARIRTWQHPEGGFLHAMHTSLWGDMHWQIEGKKNDTTLKLTGGWQNNRPAPMHPLFRMVENIKEELDAAGEWYFDQKEGNIYYFPTSDVDISQAKIEVVRLKSLLNFSGTQASPVQNIHLKGLVFRRASRTFMENKEQLLRSDWTVYRGGALMYNGAINCEIQNCEFDQLGGNSIFINNYNKNIKISGCYIHDGGANGIAFVGNPKAVHNPIFRYGPQNYATLDTAKGAKSNDFPQNCKVEDCLIIRTGRDEKQTAAVQISMSYRIDVDHCSIYDVPRAGININEGTFGGHVIENCDVFNTVLETGDHGSFNSWGRDRFWDPDVNLFSKKVAENPDMPFWDMMGPNIIRHNRWSCDHGWAIDLDDGSSYYRIYDNLLLNGGLKMREGYDRQARNNIIINSSLYAHVWPHQSRDIFTHNIVFDAYRPALMDKDLKADEQWGKLIDSNYFVGGADQMQKFQINKADLHSVYGEAPFALLPSGKVEFKQNANLEKMGFKPFDTENFGVYSPQLKAIAKTPKIPTLVYEVQSQTTATKTIWMGVQMTVPHDNEWSAYGVRFEDGGVSFGQIPQNSEALKLGFVTGDLIQKINNLPIATLNSLKTYLKNNWKANEKQVFTIVRNQKSMVITVPVLKDVQIIEQ